MKRYLPSIDWGGIAAGVVIGSLAIFVATACICGAWLMVRWSFGL